MRKRTLSLLLVLTLAVGLTVPSVAAGQTYTDVPESYWGYKDIEAAAEAGYMNGIGGGQFAPEMKVSVAQFLTLLGRLVFPEVKIGENDTWYGPHVTKAQEAGLLEGIQVDTSDVFAEIPRYDMAVILRAGAKKLGVTEKQAQASEITDYGTIPNMYTEAVLTVYGMGLIKGDNAGKFNGASTMTRAEVATVIMRLARTTGSSGTTVPTTPTPEPTETAEPIIDPDAKLVPYTIYAFVEKVDHVIGRPIEDKKTDLPNVPIQVYYTKDGGATSVLVYEGVTGNKDRVSNHPFGEGEGECAFTIELPEDAFRGKERGIYISAETELNGQRIVTSDLRTDGRAYKELKRYLAPVSDTNPWETVHVELTPPDGEKAKFTFQGYVEGINVNRNDPYYRLANFTVQLHLADGTLIGEVVSGTDGIFSMECEVDALDGGFSKEDALYYVTAIGSYNGVEYELDGKGTSGKLMLETLIDLDVINYNGIPNSDPNYSVQIVKGYTKEH